MSHVLPILRGPTIEVDALLQQWCDRDRTVVGKQEGVTLFMTLLAGFQSLLYRYTGQEDLIIGTPIANRTRAEMEGLLGASSANPVHARYPYDLFAPEQHRKGS